MADTASLMAGKRGLIMGVANDRSLAWGIARALARHGAALAFTDQGEAREKRVRPLAASVGAKLVLPCDVADDASIDKVFAEIASAWGSLDFVVHAIAFSDKEELKGEYLATTRGNFARTLDISCYSFTAVCQRAVRLMPKGGSLLTLTYYGAERVMPHYNVMGVAKATLDSSVQCLAWDLGQKNIRVNAVSAGPVRTLAARSIAGFPTMEAIVEERAPLHRHVGAEDVGAAAASGLAGDDGRSRGQTPLLPGPPTFRAHRQSVARALQPFATKASRPRCTPYHRLE